MSEESASLSSAKFSSYVSTETSSLLMMGRWLSLESELPGGTGKQQVNNRSTTGQQQVNKHVGSQLENRRMDGQFERTRERRWRDREI